jgi:hypothetical protein
MEIITRLQNYGFGPLCRYFDKLRENYQTMPRYKDFLRQTQLQEFTK